MVGRFWKVLCGSVWGNFHNRNIVTCNVERLQVIQEIEPPGLLHLVISDLQGV